jgi:peroxin-11B
MIESALKTIHLDDYFLRCILTSSSLNQACYLAMDNMLWLHSMGILDLKQKAPKISEWSNKFWLFSTILYLARDFHDLLTLIQNNDEEDKLKRGFDPTSRYRLDHVSGAYKSSNLTTDRRQCLVKFLLKIRIILMNRKNRPLVLDTIKNLTDLFLPLSSLNYVKISPGVQGICGVISSLISLLIVWDSKYKLTP